MSTYTSYDYSIIAQQALMPFVTSMTPMLAFSNNCGGVVAGATIQVPVISVAGSGSDFNTSSNNYETEDAGTTVVFKDVATTYHRKVTFALTDTQLGQANLVQQIATAKSLELAKGIQTTIFNAITTANFAGSAYIGAASAFDTDDLADIRGLVEVLGWGQKRSAILNSTFMANINKDNDIKNYMNSMSTSTLFEGKPPKLVGFDMYESAFLPNNSENLGGFVADPRAIAIGMGILKPGDTSMLISYNEVTDPGTGMTLAMRVHYSPATGKVYCTIECVFGFAITNANGILRIATA